jgi:hypothetical protein
MRMGYGRSVLFKKGFKMKIFLLAVSIFLSVASTNAFSADFLYHSDGPYKGKVVDLETGKPIEGAVVAGVWVLAFNLTPFCDAKETMTDRNGEFILPKGSCFSLWPFAEMDRMDIVVFKPGYLAYPPLGPSPEERRARMPDFTGDEFKNMDQYYIIKLGTPKTREEKEFTYYGIGGLFISDQAFKKLPLLLESVNQEGRSLGMKGGIWAYGQGREEMKKRILLSILTFVIFFSSHQKLHAYHPALDRKITQNTINQMTNRLNTYMNDYFGSADASGKFIFWKISKELDGTR